MQDIGAIECRLIRRGCAIGRSKVKVARARWRHGKSESRAARTRGKSMIADLLSLTDRGRVLYCTYYCFPSTLWHQRQGRTSYYRRTAARPGPCSHL